MTKLHFYLYHINYKGAKLEFKNIFYFPTNSIFFVLYFLFWDNNVTTNQQHFRPHHTRNRIMQTDMQAFRLRTQYILFNGDFSCIVSILSFFFQLPNFIWPPCLAKCAESHSRITYAGSIGSDKFSNKQFNSPFLRYDFCSCKA